MLGGISNWRGGSWLGRAWSRLLSEVQNDDEVVVDELDGRYAARCSREQEPKDLENRMSCYQQPQVSQEAKDRRAHPFFQIHMRIFVHASCPWSLISADSAAKA
jgi:hypothetical protein